jgi:hypothetical protein
MPHACTVQDGQGKKERDGRAFNFLEGEGEGEGEGDGDGDGDVQQASKPLDKTHARTDDALQAY